MPSTIKYVYNRQRTGHSGIPKHLSSYQKALARIDQIVRFNEWYHHQAEVPSFRLIAAHNHINRQKRALELFLANPSKNRIDPSNFYPHQMERYV
jgi:hypothetical protein